MRADFEKPMILKLQIGPMNKFGANPYHTRPVRKTIDGVSITSLAERFGSPLYVFSEKALRSRYRQMYAAFSTRYPYVQFGWSYKTNYLSAICRVMHQEGAIAEVVSAMEYEKARKTGMCGENIIFNGPRKPMDILERAAAEHAMIHIDHWDEISDLEAVAQKLNTTIKVGLRLNMDTGIRPQWSRFGVNLDSGQAMEAVKRIQHGGKLELSGLHCHIGTFILEPDAYGIAMEKMIQFAYAVEDYFGMKIEYLDMGGGLPSNNRLKGTYLPPDVSVPSIDAYAERITNAMYQHLRPGNFPKLILECGRGIVDEAGFLITTLFASKRLPDGRKAYIADAGLNLLFTSFWYKFNIEVDRKVTGLNEPSVIYGPLCMNIDMVDEGILLPPLDRGTRLVVSPVGAYNVTQSLQFIEYRPNMVMIGDCGSVDIIRQAEDLSDIDRRERIPDRLKA